MPAQPGCCQGFTEISTRTGASGPSVSGNGTGSLSGTLVAKRIDRVQAPQLLTTSIRLGRCFIHRPQPNVAESVSTWRTDLGPLDGVGEGTRCNRGSSASCRAGRRRLRVVCGAGCSRRRAAAGTAASAADAGPVVEGSLVAHGCGSVRAVPHRAGEDRRLAVPCVSQADRRPGHGQKGRTPRSRRRVFRLPHRAPGG